MKIVDELVLLVNHANKLRYHSKLTTVIAVVYDLILCGVVELDDKNRLIINDVDKDKLRDYEKDMYDIIKRYKSPSLCGLIINIYLNFNARNLYKRIISYMDLYEEGLKQRTNLIIEGIRAEVLEDERMSEETSVIVLLLKLSKCLNYYFSKYEKTTVRKKLNSIKGTKEYRFYSILRKTVIISDLLTWS